MNLNEEEPQSVLAKMFTLAVFAQIGGTLGVTFTFFFPVLFAFSFPFSDSLKLESQNKKLDFLTPSPGLVRSSG